MRVVMGHAGTPQTSLVATGGRRAFIGCYANRDAAGSDGEVYELLGSRGVD